MCLVARSDEFESQGQMSKIKVTRDKNGIFGPFTACVRFMFGSKLVRAEIWPII